jgi:Ser-tRNA(Ala) deacylase AlaX
MEKINLNSHNKKEYPPMHTAEHLLNQTMIRLFNCKRSHNAHIERKKSKCDYILSQTPTKDEIQNVEDKVNEIIAQELTVSSSLVERKDLPPSIDLNKLPEEAGELLRIVKIGDYDICACVGAHVENTSEIGHFKISSYSYTGSTLRLRFKLM